MTRAVILLFLIASANAVAQSTCFGTASNGRLEDSCKLPSGGDNFATYSHVLSIAGRTYVHCQVSEVILSAYKTLRDSHPDRVYIYGETGKRRGGPFAPHKTHQNGLSVDFMIPVKDSDGRSVALPTSVHNRYGYDIDFTLDGDFEDLSIDYEAFAADLAALKSAADSADWRRDRKAYGVLDGGSHRP